MNFSKVAFRLVLASAVAGLCATGLRAETVLDLDVTSSAGVTPGVGGIWDFNSTINWTADGGTNRVAWTDNAAAARIRLETAYGWGSVIIAVSNNNGQVGAAGVLITGSLPDWTHTVFNGDALQIGNAGVAVASTNAETYVKFESPVALTASQTWRTSNADAIDGGGTLQINAALTSAAGTTDITFDGGDLTDPGVISSSALRPGFSLAGNNAYSGTTTVTGGGYLWLAFSASASGSKLDPASPLVLQGGGVWMNGNSATFTQQVASTVVKTGCGLITARNGKGAFFCGAVSRSGLAGTVDFPVNWNGGVDAYSTTTNIGGILGGWATHNRGAFAKAGLDGNNTIIGSLTSSSRATPDNWGANENVKATGGGTRTLGDVAINSLLIATSTALDLGTAKLTVNSGGIMASYAGDNTLSGGTVRSGFATGELFVHAFNPIRIDSVIADNGGTPGVLVKNGLNALTLTATNTYSGATYLNSGTLAVTNRAALSGAVVQAGGTTLDLRNGGALTPGGTNAATLTLNGNLIVGDGTVLNMQIGDLSDAVSLTNPFATLTGSAASGGITLRLLDGLNIKKQAYTLLQWTAQTTLSSLDVSDFTVIAPAGVGGTLQVVDNSLVFTVTSLPAKGLCIRVL